MDKKIILINILYSKQKGFLFMEVFFVKTMLLTSFFFVFSFIFIILVLKFLASIRCDFLHILEWLFALKEQPL